MAELRDLPLSERLFLRAYRWRRIDPVPWAVPPGPLARCRLALVSTAGLVLPGQEPFDEAIRGGDFGFREIPRDTDPQRLLDSQRSRSYDHSGVRADANLAFPLDRVRELAGDGVIGSVASRHLSFMGSITAPGRLVRNSAPEAAGRLLADRVDLALLVPV